MAVCDFVVKYDPNKDTAQDLADRILYSIFISRRIKAKKPAISFVGGDSGEGKSWSIVAILARLLKMQGIDIKECMDLVNVYTPLQYPKKLDTLLFDKNYKKVNAIAIHEARDVVSAKDWYSFVTQVVADVNAQSRSLKRLMIFITSQFIRDITTDIRYTLNYYIIIRRPAGKKARAYISVMWKDDRDLEKPKLRKRKLAGYIVLPNGRYRRYVPKYLEISKPDKEIISQFEKSDTEAKAAILKRKMAKLIKAMEADLNVENKKVEAMIKYYSKNINNLNLIGKRIKNRWIVKPEFRKMHDMSKEEADNFQEGLNEKLRKMGVIDG